MGPLNETLTAAGAGCGNDNGETPINSLRRARKLVLNADPLAQAQARTYALIAIAEALSKPRYPAGGGPL